MTPNEKGKEEALTELGEAFKRHSKKAMQPSAYNPNVTNIYYLFTEEWRNNTILNRTFGDYHNVSPNYFATEKAGSLYDIVNYYLCDNAIMQTIYLCNMPENTWEFCKWFYNIISYDFLKEELKDIPTFKNEKSMFEYVVKHKLIEKTYQLFLKR